MRPAHRVVGLLVGAALLAGCGGGSNDEEDPSPNLESAAEPDPTDEPDDSSAPESEPGGEPVEFDESAVGSDPEATLYAYIAAAHDGDTEKLCDLATSNMSADDGSDTASYRPVKDAAYWHKDACLEHYAPDSSWVEDVTSAVGAEVSSVEEAYTDEFVPEGVTITVGGQTFDVRKLDDGNWYVDAGSLGGRKPD